MGFKECIRKVILAGILLGAFSTSVLAGSLAGERDNPINEAELADKLKFYASISKLQVSFKQTKILTSLKMQLKSEGRLTLIRPHQIIWEVSKPSHLKVNLTEQQIEIESGEGEDRTTQIWKRGDLPREDGSEQNSLHGLVAWLQLDAHLLSQQYKIISLGNQSFQFEPKESLKESKQSPFKNLKMTLGRGGHLRTLIIHELSGDELQIKFGTPTVSRGNFSKHDNP